MSNNVPSHILTGEKENFVQHYRTLRHAPYNAFPNDNQKAHFIHLKVIPGSHEY